MINFTFNTKILFRTIVVYLILTFVWTALCINYDEFADNDKGLYSGLGYLILFGISIGQNFDHLGKLLFFTILSIFTFLISSFAIGPLVGFTINSMILYAIINSGFVAAVMVYTVDKLMEIQFKKVTFILTFTLLLLAYFLISNTQDYLYMDYDLHPRISMFIIFQFALITSLSIGLSIKEHTLPK